MSAAKRHRNIALFVPHLGCPHDCVFCDQRRIAGALAAPTAADVEAACAIAAQSGDPAGAEVAFFGGSFTAIERPLMDSLLGAAQSCVRHYGFAGIRLSTRPDAIDTDMLGRLRRYGVTAVELGAQSMDDRVLVLSGRGHTSAHTLRAAELIKAAGLELVLQMMTGLPGDTPAGALATTRALLAMAPAGLRVYPTVVVRGTALHALYERGEYAPLTFGDAVDLCADILRLCLDAGVPVIRMGLHASEGLSGGDVVAGPYHPAFGELVQSSLMLAVCREALQRVNARGANVTLLVHPAFVSRAAGHHSSNIEALAAEFGTRRLRVAADARVGSYECRLLLNR